MKLRSQVAALSFLVTGALVVGPAAQAVEPISVIADSAEETPSAQSEENLNFEVDEGPAGEGVGLDVSELLSRSSTPTGEGLLDDVVPIEVGDEGGIAAHADFADHTIELAADPGEGVVITTNEGPEIHIALPSTGEERATIADDMLQIDNQNHSMTIPQILENGSLRVLMVLESASAPTRYDYPVAVSGGGSIELDSEGGFSVLDAAGEEVAVAETPWAIDATGSPVPTHYEVSGSTVTQIVDTEGLTADQFPVVADPIVSIVRYYYKVANIQRGKGTKNLSQRIGTCSIGVGGGSCDIRKGRTASRTIQLATGVTFAGVASNLGISSSKSVDVSVSCTSPMLKAGTIYKGYAYGNYFTYKVEKWKRHTAGARTRHTKMSTSSTLTAFNPWASAIHCQV